MYRPIISTEIKTVIKNIPTNKSSGPDSFIRDFYQMFREELTLSCTNSFKKLQREENLQILWGHHHTDTKTRQRYYKKRKLQANITDEHRHKNPEQNTSKPNPVTVKRIIHYDQVGFISGMQRFFNIHKLINVIHHIKN